MKAVGLLRRAFNRIIHLVARNAPGAMSVRPFLHRLRGVKIGKNVVIGDDVYLENDHPELVEIQDGVWISIRATIMAHTRGLGKVILERESYVGPHAVVVASGGRTVRVGEGAVIGAGCVVTRDIKARVFFNGEFGKPVAEARVPLSTAPRIEDFVRGLAPLRPGGDSRQSRGAPGKEGGP